MVLMIHINYLASGVASWYACISQGHEMAIWKSRLAKASRLSVLLKFCFDDSCITGVLFSDISSEVCLLIFEQKYNFKM